MHVYALETSQHTLSTKSYAGFTLLELLITLAIVSLLMMVSYPIYTQHTIKARRAYAEIALLNLASALEKYHVVKNTYVGATFTNLQINEYLDNKTYRLEINNVAENSYVIKARPQGVQKADKLCDTLTLNALGKKGITGVGKVADCW